MNIITAVPKYSDGEVNRAFMREIKTGFRLERETEKARTDIARKESSELKGSTHPVLGKPVAVIPGREFFRLVNNYGHETVHSKSFLKYLNKKHPDLSPNRA